MNLPITVIENLTQLHQFVHALPEGALTRQDHKTGHSTIGMHLRHVLEFYIGILDNGDATIVNYDLRKRELSLEQDITTISETIVRLTQKCKELTTEKLLKPIDFQACYSTESDVIESHPSSLSRELAYGLEHAIHHMAIIKLSCYLLEIPIQLDANFGVAYSTQRNASTCAQ